jgi:excisionase family DNA binding protein
MTDPSDGHDWLTVAESAKYAKMSTRTIRQRIHDGDLAAYIPRGSRLLLVDRADLDAMIRHGGKETLAAQIRRVIAEHGDTFPEPTDDQIREIARLLPRPAVTAADSGAA